MSKYENEHFVNMKISIFLIIGFTHLVFCCDQNVTDDSFSECPINFFRRKRAPTEYTRWRANIDTTPAFIVKILDDEAYTPKKKKIVAINIQPVTKGGEKIIIGGAIVSPSKTVATATPPDTSKDYTRFVPPTTIATQVDGGFFLAPVEPVAPVAGPDNLIAIHPHARSPQRDESPPASPQFLRRDPVVAARQYAPITPVGFTVRTFAPLTPPQPTTKSSILRNQPISRTPAFGELLTPTRTKTDTKDFSNYVPFNEDNERDYVTRTTFIRNFGPQRTSNELETTPAVDFHFIPTTEKIDENYGDKMMKNYVKDTDANEGMLFYNYDDLEKDKKSAKDLIDVYDQTETSDQSKDDDEQQANETDNQKVTDKEKETTKTDENFNITISKIPFGLQLQDDNDIKEENVIIEESDTLRANDDTTSTLRTIVERITKKKFKDVLRDKRRQVCNMVKLRELDFNSPRTLPEIEAKLKQWAEDSPVAKWVDITDGNLTTMERPIYMMIVDDPSSGQVITAKETVMIVAGIQGRDHYAVAAAMYVLYQLIERSEAHIDLLGKYRFWIIPVFNPDGYDYSMTFPHRREWAKNLRQKWDICKGREACQSCESRGLRCSIQPCYGVNLDRNFEYQWIPAEELRTEHPCGSLYAGQRQLSEIETSAFTIYLHSQHRPLFAFVAFKEGDVLGVMYPYSHTRKKRAFEHIYKQRASRAAAAAYSINGRPYVAGQTSEFLPLYAGGIEDWVDGHLGVDNTYTVMMFRPADTYNSNIMAERVVHEAYAAMDTLVLQSLEQSVDSIPPVVMTRSGVSETLSAPTPIICTIAAACVTTVHTFFT